MEHKAKSIRPFVGAKNFALSRSFYRDLGFQENMIDNRMSYFKTEDVGTSSNSNYQFSIHADNAWVSHQEESIAKDGVKTHSYEIRMLEKIHNEWKLVGQSIHVYKP